MRENKVSQVSLAKDMGVTPQYINKILQGKENMTIETICRIESALGINLIEVVFSNTQTYDADLIKSVTPQFTTLSVAKESIEWNSAGYQQNVA